MTGGEHDAAWLDRLAGSTDPLGTGLVMAADRGPSAVLAVADRFGARVTPRHAQDLLAAGARLGEVAADAGGNAAIAWLRAGATRARGDRAAAAQAAAASRHDEPAEMRAFRELFCGRELVHVAGAHDLAWRHARAAARDARDVTTLLAIDALRERLRRHGPPPTRRAMRVAFLGNVTLDIAAPAIRAAALGRDVDVELHVGGYGLYRQEILAPDSRVDAFSPDVVVLILDVRALGIPEELADPDAFVAEEVARAQALWRRASERWGAAVFQTNYVVPSVSAYGGLSATLAGGRDRALRSLDLALADAAAQQPGVHIIDAEQLAATVGKARWEDAAAWHTAKQSPGPDGLPALAHRVAAMLQALAGLSAKCLVLDLDDTIWGGAVGDVGSDGIVLGGSAVGEAFVEFQRYLRALAGRGIALAVCSKNDEENARAPFRSHPEMVLREEDISCFIANWLPKTENLPRIAEALNIGLDSLVAADDNPLERELVRARFPEVRVVDLPADPAGFARAVADSLAFESLTLTAEDRSRTASYQAETRRATTLATPAMSVDELIASLGMTAELSPFRDVDVPRLHQLTNKTNQFNLTTVRMTEAEVRDLVGRADVVTQSLRLRDRFGDYGLVALLIAREASTALRIEQWLMSCRVFGRRVEDLMIARLATTAIARGATTLVGEYRPTSKNREFAGLYVRLGFRLLAETADGATVHEADAATIASRGVPPIRVLASEEVAAGAR